MGNNPISYTSRDFKSIKQDLINAIPSLTNIWTNREESDPGMVLLTLAAALGDNLNYNIDKQSLEFFGQTVTQRKNAARVFDLVGYKMHWYKSAELKVTIYNNNDSQVTLLFNPTSANTQRLVSNIIPSAPAYFLLYPEETPANWNTNRVITIPARQSIELTAIQGELNSLNFSSTAIDSNNRFYLPISKLDQNHIWLSDDKKFQWYLVDSINELTETIPRFEFGVDEYNLPYIEFVPHWRTSFGKVHNFTLYYLNTRGSAGAVTSNVLNSIPALKNINSIGSASNKNSDFNNNIAIVHGSNAFESDDLNNKPGQDPQTAQSAYNDSRNYIGTYNTLVTLIDFENFMRRIGLISSVKAIDGQYASELNEKLLNSLNKKYRNDEFGADKVLALYDANKITYNNADHTIDLEENYFGFKPYTLQLHMIANNFLEYKPLSDKKSVNQWATTTEITAGYLDKLGNIIIRNVDEDDNETFSRIDYNYTENKIIESPVSKSEAIPQGYINYMLTDKIIGSSDDSTVSQSGINKYKLFTADLSYAPVRKFPFFINGQIHLKEPMRPAEANLVLYNVWVALQDRFQASNLTLGEKINFKDILDTINEADENIYYFDAGANSKTGSLIEYPNAGEFNYTKYNPETINYDPYTITINPDYFNEVSMQAFADVLQNNNVLMYFCNTFSGRLTISEDSISIKDTPPVFNTELQVDMNTSETIENSIDIKINLYTKPDKDGNSEIIIDNNQLFRYNIVESIVWDGEQFQPNDINYPVKFYNDETVDINGRQSYDINKWKRVSEFNWPENKPTHILTPEGNEITGVTKIICALAIVETISTNESSIIYADMDSSTYTRKTKTDN